MESLVNFVETQFIEKKDFPEISSGDTVTVFYDIREGDKVRTQFFKGVIIKVKGTGLTKTFTIRKMSGNICLLYTSPSPRDGLIYGMPSCA